MLAALFVLSGLLTYGLYQQSAALNFKRMQDTVQSIASTGAIQIDPADIDALQVEEDWKKPEWVKVVSQKIN